MIRKSRKVPHALYGEPFLIKILGLVSTLWHLQTLGNTKFHGLSALGNRLAALERRHVGYVVPSEG